MATDYFKIVSTNGKNEKVKCGLMQAAKYFCQTHLSKMMEEYKQKGEKLFYYTPNFTEALQYFKYVLTSPDHWDKTIENPMIDLQTIARVDSPDDIVYKFLLVRLRQNLIIIANISDNVENIEFFPTLPANILDIANSSLGSIRDRDGVIKQVFSNENLFITKMAKIGIKL